MPEEALTISGVKLLNMLEDILSASRDVVWFWSPSEHRIRFNSRVADVTGYGPDDLIDYESMMRAVYFADKWKVRQLAEQGLDPSDSPEPASLEHRIVCRGGDIRWVRTSFRRITPSWGEPGMVIGTITDIDTEKRSRSRLREQNYRDPMTGLPNRGMMEYKMQAYMESVRRNRRLLALIHIDLDGFKMVNETCGHAVGDLALQQIGDVLSSELPLDTTVFRIGGDEFALLVKNLENREEIEQIMQNITKALASSIIVNDRHILIHASAGIAVYPGYGTTPDEIQNQAGTALVQAKAKQSGSWCFFTPDLQEDMGRRAGMEMSLRRAIRDKEFRLVYQPQVDVESGRINGVEALLRWNDPERGNISPLELIPVAEDCGMMPDIGGWVLETACRQLKSWIDAGAPPVRVAVNISPQQFREPDFYPSLRRILSMTGLDPRLLELEITESMFLENPEAVRDMFEKIRDCGVRIALDDFGTGYSSLNYIKNFKLDRLKIDRAFIHDMKAHSVENAITGTIVVLSHILGLEVVAEGVETREQFNYLQEVGCNTIQGYYFSHPAEAGELPRLLREGNTRMKGADPDAFS
ncbi:MAG: EAL domain-containing protein [Clostridia bacterium]|nr:EAL domain-containing protein [Clostridia bacterium]